MKILLIIAVIFASLIALLLLLSLFGKVGVRIIYREKVKIKVVAFGIPITVFSSDKKRKEGRDLSRCHDPDRILRRELARQKKRLEKAKEKERKKAERKKQHKKKKDTTKNVDPAPNLKENLDMILTLLKKLHREAQGSFDLKVNRMHIRIGGKDAADTALRYGVVVQSAAILLQWIQDHFMKIRRRDGSICIEPDFLSSKTTVDIDIRLSIHLRSSIRIGIRMLFAFLTERKGAQKRAAQRMLESLKKTQ